MKKLFAATLFGLLASTTVAANAAEFIRYMRAGEILHKGDVLRSPNNLFRLIMQNDGNLVLYFFPGINSGAYSRWSTGSNPNGDYAAIQNNGNLAVYTSSNTWAWQAGNGDKPIGNYQLVLDDNGSLYIAYPSVGSGVGSYMKGLHTDICPGGVPATTFPATTNVSTNPTFFVTANCGMRADQLAIAQGGLLTGTYYSRP